MDDPLPEYTPSSILIESPLALLSYLLLPSILPLACGEQRYSEEGKAKDDNRDRYMESKGLRVLGFSDRDIFENLRGVIEEIWSYL